MAFYQHARKILLLSYLLLLISNTFGITNQRWQGTPWESNNNILDLPLAKDQQKFTEDYECNNNNLCDAENEKKDLLKIVESNEIPNKRRPNSGFTTLSTYDKLLQMDQSRMSSDIAPYFHTSALPLPCACGSHYRLMDLGRAYLPRYLLTAVCDANACGAIGTYHCRQRNYHVRVLKRRNMSGSLPEKEPDTVSNPTLPESLKNDWEFQTFSVTVACECGP